MTEPFSHFVFWQHPLQALCFFSLIMCFASFWISRSAWVWGAFFAIAYFLAYHTGIVDLYSIIWIALLALCHLVLSKKITGLRRALLVVVASALSFAIIFRLLPGFHNWEFGEKLRISKDGVPFGLWLNFGKPMIGLFILAFGLPLIETKARLWQVAKKAIPLSVLGIFIMLFPAIYSGEVHWDPKIPSIFFVWTVINIFLVCIPEETFFRGFIQREFHRWFGPGLLSSIGCVVATAFIFALVHVGWVNHLPFLALVFIAGLIYGGIYQYTQAIEASIFCHFFLNFTHFMFFTYPAIAK